MSPLNRRQVLRGAIAGACVSVGLPLLDVFLNDNGNAYAGEPSGSLPPCFGTWFWGCGLSPGQWEPKATGRDYTPPMEIASFAPLKNYISVFSGFNTRLGNETLVQHGSGAMSALAGNASKLVRSMDDVIAETIGATTRFRSLEVSCNGLPQIGWSRRSPTVANPSEISPVALYGRIFGVEFHDPNAANFVPDPRIMVRRSALSAITDSRNGLMAQLGASDKARMDEYFTSLRELEGQLALDLERPPAMPSCTRPSVPEEMPPSTEWGAVTHNHRLFTQLLTHALACDQTRVVNVALMAGQSDVWQVGDTITHHQLTHEDRLDEKLGYQPRVSSYSRKIMETFASFVQALYDIKEGDGTLLDRTAVVATSEGGFAQIHSLENQPIFLAGKGSGRFVSGIHVAAPGDPITRVGLTVQRAYGVPIIKWGEGAMETNKVVSEILT